MTDRMRFTISISDEMKDKLERIKQEKYYNTTKNAMINDLIALGLKVYQEEKEINKNQNRDGSMN